jgi:hypothetical protein
MLRRIRHICLGIGALPAAVAEATFDAVAEQDDPGERAAGDHVAQQYRPVETSERRRERRLARSTASEKSRRSGIGGAQPSQRHRGSV